MLSLHERMVGWYKSQTQSPSRAATSSCSDPEAQMVPLHERVLSWRVADVVTTAGLCARVRQRAELSPDLPSYFDNAEQQRVLLEPLLADEVLASLEVRS